MNRIVTAMLCAAGLAASAGCSVFGKPGVEIADFELEQQDGKVEVRLYRELVMVSTPMSGRGTDDGAAFQRLFDYISGENRSAAEISMTAPVVMDSADDQGEEISMTAPVILDNDPGDSTRRMSFVLPRQYVLDTAPVPTNPDVSLRQITDLRVAVVRFSGLLSADNVARHRAELEQWIDKSEYVATGPYKSAGYNPPWTLPNLRRNEVMIPVKKPN